LGFGAGAHGRSMAKATCATDDCESPAYARGWCSTCYGRRYRTGTLDDGEAKVGWHAITNARVDERLGDCAICGPAVPLVIRGTRSGWRGVRCRANYLAGKRTPDQRRRSAIKQKYGLAPAELDAMLRSQDSRCAICKLPPAVGKRLVIDHDHATLEVRGLLCHRCNVGLGWMDDDPKRLLAAAHYLIWPAARTA
jgi:hypothetical protein